MFTEEVQTAETGRMFVQAYRPRTGPTESSIEVHGLDVLGMYEKYYRRSEQSAGRLFDLDDDRFVLVRALPDADPPELEDMDRDGARALLDGKLEPMQRTDFRFWCGCNPERILGALRGMFGTRPEELFRGKSRVAIARHRLFPIDRPDEVRPPQTQGVSPLVLHEFRPHRV